MVFPVWRGKTLVYFQTGQIFFHCMKQVWCLGSIVFSCGMITIYNLYQDPKSTITFPHFLLFIKYLCITLHDTQDLALNLNDIYTSSQSFCNFIHLLFNVLVVYIVNVMIMSRLV